MYAHNSRSPGLGNDLLTTVRFCAEDILPYHVIVKAQMELWTDTLGNHTTQQQLFQQQVTDMGQKQLGKIEMNKTTQKGKNM